MIKTISFIVGVALSFALVIGAANFISGVDVSGLIDEFNQLNEIPDRAATTEGEKETAPSGEANDADAEKQADVAAAQDDPAGKTRMIKQDLPAQSETAAQTPTDAATETPAPVDLAKAESLEDIYESPAAQDAPAAGERNSMEESLGKETAREDLRSIWATCTSTLEFLE